MQTPLSRDMRSFFNRSKNKIKYNKNTAGTAACLHFFTSLSYTHKHFIIILLISSSNKGQIRILKLIFLSIKKIHLVAISLK